MALTTGITSGAYTATWNALAIGELQLGGIRERYQYSSRPIFFDSVGSTPVDHLFGGVVMFLDFVCMNYNAAAIQSMRWPWHATRGMAPVSGGSLWEMAKPLILIGCRNDINPLTKTYYKTILAPGQDVELDFTGSKERTVPIRLMVFPRKYVSGGATTELPAGCVDLDYYSETLVA